MHTLETWILLKVLPIEYMILGVENSKKAMIEIIFDTFYGQPPFGGHDAECNVVKLICCTYPTSTPCILELRSCQMNPFFYTKAQRYRNRKWRKLNLCNR